MKWTEFHGFASSPALTFFDVMSVGSIPARGQVFSTPPKEVLAAYSLQWMEGISTIAKEERLSKNAEFTGGG
jgi:hypothetical protein